MHDKEIQSFILSIAQEMKKIQEIKKFMLDPANSNSNPFKATQSWDDLSLVSGYPTLLLFFTTLHKMRIMDNEEIIHHLILNIKVSLEQNGIVDLSLYNGLSGIIFVLKQACGDGKRYQKMLNALNLILINNIDQFYLQPILKNIGQNLPSQSRLFDVICGISGIGRFALENISQPSFNTLVVNITKTLIKFCEPLTIKGKKVPGWFQLDFLNKNPYSSDGYFNLGLAHGITGVLAFLAITLLKGIEVDGHREAIMRIALWLRSKSFLKNSSILWPDTVSWEEETQGITVHCTHSRDGWCNGAPGIARALYLAGKALNDTTLTDFGLNAFRGIFTRDQKDWGIVSPNLCHGIAGLLITTTEMARDEKCDDLNLKVKLLTNILLTHYQPNAPFGFKDKEFCPNNNYAEVSKICFLEGSIGVLLSLLSLSDLQPELQWHLPLMIHV